MAKQSFQRDTPQNLIGYGGAQVLQAKSQPGDLAGSFLKGRQLKQQEEQDKLKAAEREKAKAERYFKIDQKGYQLNTANKKAEELVSGYFAELSRIGGGNPYAAAADPALMPEVEKAFSGLQMGLLQLKELDDKYVTTRNNLTGAEKAGLEFEGGEGIDEIEDINKPFDIDKAHQVLDSFKIYPDWREFKVESTPFGSETKPEVGVDMVTQRTEGEKLQKETLDKGFRVLQGDAGRMRSLEIAAERKLDKDAVAKKHGVKNWTDLTQDQQKEAISEQARKTYEDYQYSINPSWTKVNYDLSKGSRDSGSGKAEDNGSFVFGEEVINIQTPYYKPGGLFSSDKVVIKDANAIKLGSFSPKSEIMLTTNYSPDMKRLRLGEAGNEYKSPEKTSTGSGKFSLVDISSVPTFKKGTKGPLKGTDVGGQVVDSDIYNLVTMSDGKTLAGEPLTETQLKQYEAFKGNIEVVPMAFIKDVTSSKPEEQSSYYIPAEKLRTEIANKLPKGVFDEVISKLESQKPEASLDLDNDGLPDLD